jgi:hypothetical protein
MGEVKDRIMLLPKLYGEYAEIFTIIFCVFIIYYSIKLLRKGSEQANIVPGLAVSLGIFFTFLGLAMSLIAASGGGIDTQYNMLVGGLSTAFWTSVVGIGVSIASKVYLAKQVDLSPLSGIENEVKKVRHEIHGLGEDINEKLTKGIHNVIDNYMVKLANSLDRSQANINNNNTVFQDSLKKLNDGIQGTLGSLSTSTNEFSKSMNQMASVSKGIHENLESSHLIIASQHNWMNEIKRAMGSISEMAPEAKSVFQGIVKVNEQADNLTSRIEKVFDEKQVVFSKDLEKVTDNILKGVASIDTEYQKIISTQLVNLDKTLHKSLGTTMEVYGEGMVEMLKKKLEIIAVITDKLDKAKEGFFVLEKEKEKEKESLVTEKDSKGFECF